MKRIIFLLVFIHTINIYATSSDTLTVSGVVLEVESKIPIINAEINVDFGNIKAITDSNGMFIISGLNQGGHLIEINKIGYKKLTKQIHLDASNIKECSFALLPLNFITPEILISSSKLNSKFIELSDNYNKLDGNDLQSNLGQTVAATLKNETSIAIRSMGPATARPVIRGLGGNRIIIAQDGIESNDLSSTSPDHALTIEPYSAESIEIIRGAKSVLYTTSMSGGVINVTKNTIPTREINNFELNSGLYYESVNNGWQGNLKAILPINKFSVSASTNFNKTENIASPKKILENTNSDHFSYSLGSAYNNIDISSGVSFDYFSFQYGVPGGFLGGHPKGVDIDLKKNDINFSLISHFHQGLFDNAELLFQRSYYHHTEFESNGSIGAEFVQRLITTKLIINQKEIEVNEGSTLNGSYGLDYDYSDRKMGGFVFTPPSKSIGLATFLFEDYSYLDFYIQFGIRLAYDKYNPEIIATTKNPENVIDKEYLTYGISGSVMKKYWESFYTGFSLYHSERPPTLEELYSEGPHLAAYSYEIGNPALSKEKGDGFELFTYYQTDNLFLMLNTFFNYYDSYIIPRNSGDTNFTILLPIFETEGVESMIYGIESAFKTNYNKIFFEANFSYVIGKMIEELQDLPMIPPFKGNLHLSYKQSAFQIGTKCEFALEQNRIDKFELATKGYVVYGLFGNYNFILAKTVHSFSINVENLFNTVYRNHLSRIKSIMPEPGINIRLSYRMFI